jgi:hypothetical protein
MVSTQLCTGLSIFCSRNWKILSLYYNLNQAFRGKYVTSHAMDILETFPILVQVFRSLPLGGKPIAVNKYHIIRNKETEVSSLLVTATRLNFYVGLLLLAPLSLQAIRESLLAIHIYLFIYLGVDNFMTVSAAEAMVERLLNK